MTCNSVRYPFSHYLQSIIITPTSILAPSHTVTVFFYIPHDPSSTRRTNDCDVSRARRM
ncbi:hypothetical protein JVT61DRAFT_8007 [Boletus reticuloceps]|uniref:Uncharacterized protein n=1 Tax=Boletus reticuloceps TaxID=495285 RepID=A0A8I3A6N3_9AGAM|nr:hypothetical protein JVT61DRAFT_8007 [Boletus reticuloceps]